jgi:hypothetical protein
MDSASKWLYSVGKLISQICNLAVDPSQYKRKANTVLFSVLILVLTVCRVEAAQRIFLFDFENGQGIEDVFGTNYAGYWAATSHVAVTSHEPHSGNYCIRSNLGTTNADSITGLPAVSNAHLVIGGTNFLYGATNNFRDRHGDELYISFWWRWDPGVLNQGVKIVYNQGQNCGSILCDWQTQPPVGSYSFYQDYPEPWGSGYLSKTNTTGAINDGEWHQVEQYFRYSDGLYWCKIDGIEIYRRNGFALPGARLTYFSFAHEHPYERPASEGFQIDDIEIWDGLPSGNELDSDGDGVPDSLDAFPSNAAIQTTQRLADADNDPKDGTLSTGELAAFMNRWQANNPDDDVQYEEVQLAIEWHTTGVMPLNWNMREAADVTDLNDAIQMSLPAE